MLYTFCLAVFLLLTGWGQLGGPSPQWLQVICGVCGVIAGIILLIGVL